MASKKKIITSDYFLTPPARILSEEEKVKLFEKYGITQPEKEMPLILSTDPVVVALKAKKGDVIEFDREDYTGKYKYYRYVV
jgi:DNA-directed RNA polymerase subunit H (RpoH/RPB5)